MQQSETKKQNSVIVYLTRQKDLWIFIHSIKYLYRNFNNVHNYPVVVFHDDVTGVDISNIMVQLHHQLGYVPNIKFEKLSFVLPDNISSDPAKYIHPSGHPISLSNFPIGYRHMCRFYALDIVNHAAMKPYRYFMRMDSDSFLLSSISIDPFQRMKDSGYVYCDCVSEQNTEKDNEWSFAAKEISWAREGLWESTNQYITANSCEIFNPPTNYEGELYNTNMEILDMDFFRQKNYQEFLTHIVSDENFYYKRWGDHCIRWLGLRLFSDPKKIWWGVKDLNFCYQHGGLIVGAEKANPECVSVLPEPFKTRTLNIINKGETDVLASISR